MHDGVFYEENNLREHILQHCESPTTRERWVAGDGCCYRSIGDVSFYAMVPIQYGYCVQEERFVLFPHKPKTSIQIFVSTTFRRTLVINTNPEDTVLRLKQTIEVNEGIPVHLQCLHTKDNVPMKDTNTLASYGIWKESTVHLTFCQQ